MTVQINVPRFCAVSICGWNLFKLLGIVERYWTLWSRPFPGTYSRQSSLFPGTNFYVLPQGYILKQIIDLLCTGVFDLCWPFSRYYHIWIFTHLKLWLATATYNFNGVNIMRIRLFWDQENVNVDVETYPDDIARLWHSDLHFYM